MSRWDSGFSAGDIGSRKKVSKETAEKRTWLEDLEIRKAEVREVRQARFGVQGLVELPPASLGYAPERANSKSFFSSGSMGPFKA
jgi:hypothetical protein